MHWEHEPEYLGPKRNRVLGGGKRASEWVNRWRNERLLETVHLGIVAPGLGSSEEPHGAGRRRGPAAHFPPPDVRAFCEGASACLTEAFCGSRSIIDKIRYNPIFKIPLNASRNNGCPGSAKEL